MDIIERCNNVRLINHFIDESCEYLKNRTRYDMEIEDTIPVMSERDIIDYRCYMVDKLINKLDKQ